MSNITLEMTFQPNTIEHLGARLYTQVPAILAELIANSYDADAENVYIDLQDQGEKRITVRDDGEGMTLEEIQEHFLKIGRNRREKESEQRTKKLRRWVIGKKGIGKLSFFGIAQKIEITTVKEGKKNTFVLDWEKIKRSQGTYQPEHTVPDEPCDEDEPGTVIVLKNIKRKTGFDAEKIADSISRYFIIEDDFKIHIRSNEKEDYIRIDEDRRYRSLPKENLIKWHIPSDAHVPDFKEKVKGLIMATSKPIPAKGKLRGIVLLSRKKLVDGPSYFDLGTSSHFYSYVTGHLEADFVDDIGSDVIATDRQSVNWEHPEMAKLQNGLKQFLSDLEQQWRVERKKRRDEELRRKLGEDIAKWLEQMPSEERSFAKRVLEMITEFVEDEGKAFEVIKVLHEHLLPGHLYFHYRKLHPKIKEVSQKYYEQEDYATALHDAITEYRKKVHLLCEESDQNESFQNILQRLSVTEKYREKKDISSDTLDNIDAAQNLLSQGINKAARNPRAHETSKDLQESGLLTESDCLNLLGLLSYLYRRLDDAEPKKPKSPKMPG